MPSALAQKHSEIPPDSRVAALLVGLAVSGTLPDVQDSPTCTAGRGRMYPIGVTVFLVGSVCCGAAMSMGQLIAARLLQGLGTGAIIPISMTIVGELYTLAERARAQALFSGVWGVASICRSVGRRLHHRRRCRATCSASATSFFFQSWI